MEMNSQTAIEPLKKICAWCLAKLPGHDESATLTTHGICPECAEKMKQEREAA